MSFDLKYVVAPPGTKFPRTPLSDEARNCIVYYLDPNARLLELVDHKEFKDLHESVPLRIDILQLGQNYIAVNHVKWSFVSYLHSYSPEDPLPDWVKAAHKAGGFKYDCDRYGKEDAFKGMKPGDVEIPKMGAPLENSKRKSKNAQKFVQVIRVSMDDLLTGENGVDLLYEENTIRDLLRKQACSFLGPVVVNGRRRTNEVKHLKIDCDGGILRLPQYLKMRIQFLSLPVNAFQIAFILYKIVDLKSRPLKLMKIGVVGPDDPIFTEKIWFPSVLQLQLELPEGSDKMQWKNRLLSLRPSTIQLFNHELSWKDFYGIVKNWKENNPRRRIGSLFSMCAVDVQGLMKSIKNHLRGKEAWIPEKSLLGFPRAFSVPLNSRSELNFYVEPSPYFDGTGFEFMIRMEIMEKGSAQPWKIEIEEKNDEVKVEVEQEEKEQEQEEEEDEEEEVEDDSEDEVGDEKKVDDEKGEEDDGEDEEEEDEEEDDEEEEEIDEDEEEEKNIKKQKDAEES
ncbi:hypothetical protein CAEBREN_03589 [Caenorhabditis brenneri]|uniref:Uncharacterized protein n=1 Tax=Caenorhabditis brenneri TaxID=135651 RepID=G0MDR4_CAEBE|nr:hypothetical protein CAEBREN_03589 [Caenorhabditis brenneri]